MNFLAKLAHDGASYSVVNTARSSLSSIIMLPGNLPVGNHPLVKRLLRGIFVKQPSLPRYKEIWDVDIVFTFLRNVILNCELSLKMLTLKLVMLLALLTGQRCQTLQALNISNMVLSEEKCVFYITELLKSSKPGRHLSAVELLPYPKDRQLCVVSHLNSYIERTASLRGEITQLLISYQKPFKAVTTDTIARWLRTVLSNAGVDTSVYKAHSTRAASTSAAKKAGIPIDLIMKAADWSSDSTFVKHYQRTVNKKNYSCELLDSLHVGK